MLTKKSSIVSKKLQKLNSKVKMYKQIAANKRKTIFLMIGFIVFISAISCFFPWYTGDWSILIITLVISVVYTLIQFFLSGSLTTIMAGAKEIEKKDCPRLYNAVENLSITTGLPMPKVYIIDDPAPNAFAAGRDPKHSVVAATTGLLDIMNDNELTAVMGHEMSHIKNYDIRVSTIVVGLVFLVGFLADLASRMIFYGNRKRNEERSPVGLVIMLLVAILTPIFAAIVQMAISREREYLADASSVNITRYPEGMIAALKKLQSHSQPMRNQNSATAQLYINNPLRKSFLSNLFCSHILLVKQD